MVPKPVLQQVRCTPAKSLALIVVGRSMPHTTVKSPPIH